MSNDDIAAAVLECVGGWTNVKANSLCATRLRISLRDASEVDRNALHSINGVLGIAEHGTSGIEVVFGPNLVKGVHQAFERLVGPFAPEQRMKNPVRLMSKLQVRITPETPGKPPIALASTPAASEDADDDTDSLLELLQETQPEEADADSDADEAGTDGSDHPRLLVINGPNLNLLGIREPELYGNADFASLLELCHESAREAGFASCECYQSNHEGDLVDAIQDAYGTVEGIVINPAAYTHTSIALLDALKAVHIPTVEVHISSVDAREDFRKESYVRHACFETITGQGIEGYRTAIFDLAARLGIVAR